MRMRYLYQCLCLFMIFLVGCHQNYAPVSDINRSKPKLSGIHIVQPGETLYAIGWRYNRDFKELAQVNHIAAPYTIRVGQEISLAAAPQKVVSSEKIVEMPTVAQSKTIVTSSASSVVTSAASTPSVVVAEKTTPVVSEQKSATPLAVQQKALPKVVNKSDWQWPVKGEIIGRFAQTKGIDIAGKESNPIKAAAAGRVVYSGNGLRGYGQLLIIKHNEQYLSAYAHNSKLMVKEGDWVSAGQEIAQMGKTDTDRVKLHFEIRKDGKPVDPLQYLPT